MTIELLDPRRDLEPAYWQRLRERAGLRADWAWEVLAVQAWGTRARLLVAVRHGEHEPTGLVCAAWATFPPRRNSFLSIDGRSPLGVLHSSSPGSPSLPGWWAAPGASPGELFHDYQREMRRVLGRGCLGMVLRQVSRPVLDGLATPFRLARPTEPLWTVHAESWRTREDWLRSLRKSRRSNLRAMSRRIEDAGRVECRTDAGGGGVDPAAVTELVRANASKYGGRLLPPAPQLTEYLAALLRRPDVISLRYTDRLTGELLGFGTVFDHPARPVWRHWAMVPIAEGGAADLYFHHFGRMVDWVVAERRPGLVLGKGNGAVKQSLGGSSIEQYAVAVPGW